MHIYMCVCVRVVFRFVMCIMTLNLTLYYPGSLIKITISVCVKMILALCYDPIFNQTQPYVTPLRTFYDRNLRMFVISKCVRPWQAFSA
jgi:hypothetical protein